MSRPENESKGEPSLYVLTFSDGRSPSTVPAWDLLRILRWYEEGPGYSCWAWLNGMLNELASRNIDFIPQMIGRGDRLSARDTLSILTERRKAGHKVLYAEPFDSRDLAHVAISAREEDRG